MKKKILSLILVAVFVALATLGCGKKTSKTDSTPESDSPSIDYTTEAELEAVETTVSANGEVFTVIKETDENGEVVTDENGMDVVITEPVTDSDGNSVTVADKETSKETSKEETTASETKPVETTKSETNPVETTASETKPVETTAEETKPVPKPVTLSSISASVSGTYNVGDTVPKSNVTVTAKYSDGSSKSVSNWSANTLKLTGTSNTLTISYGGKTTTVTVKANEVSKIPSNWTITTWSDGEDDYKVYSNGVYLFDFVDNSLSNDFWGKDCMTRKGVTSGIYLIDYIGSDSRVSIPASIDGYSVTGLCYTFYEDENVTEITVPSSVMTLQDAFWGAKNLVKVTISAGSKLTGDGAFASDSIFKTGSHNANNPLPIYCEKAVADALASWGHVSVKVMSLDGKTVYYQS